MTRLRFTPFLLLALTVACDCGDDDDTTVLDDVMDDAGPPPDGPAFDGGDEDGGVEPDPLDGFALDYAEAYCAKLDECFGPAADDLTIPDCVASVEAEIGDALIPAWRASEAAGSLVIDETMVAACEASLRDDVTCASLNEFLAPGCAAAFAPGAATGDSCRTQQDCPAGDYCDIGAACPGTCTTFAALGASCEDAECAPDAYCDEVSVCQALPALGEPCDLDIACTGLLFCSSDGDPDPSCRTAAQVFTVTEGMACQVSDSGPYCVDGQSCVVEGDGFVCRPLVGSGEACSAGFPDPCPSGEACDTGAGFMGTCAPAAGLGEPCTGQPCGPGLVCGETSRTCLSLARLGDACTENIECGSLLCDEGACASPACVM